MLAVIAGMPGCSSSGSNPASGANNEGGVGASSAALTSTVTMGPIDLAAGDEKTVCIVKSLGNTEDMVLSSIDATLAPGSHHLIVYRTTAAENLTPTPCMPFGGVGVGADRPVLIVTTPTGSWKFPDGVGLELKPDQMLRIEAHYINTGSTDIQGHGTVTFHGAPAAAAPFQPADVFVWGTLNISVPAKSQASTPVNFQAGIAGTQMLSISTHEHRLGTLVQAWESPGPGSQGMQIANDKDWSNPAWTALEPPFAFDGRSGVSYQCSWNNTTDQAVMFGESALDEMCFILGYYYPSTGVDVCVDGACEYRAADAGAASD
jgi:hypothetical protein